MTVRDSDSQESGTKNENLRGVGWQVYKRYFCHSTVDSSGLVSERYLHAPRYYEDEESGEAVSNGVVDRYAPLHADTLFLDSAG